MKKALLLLAITGSLMAQDKDKPKVFPCTSDASSPCIIRINESPVRPPKTVTKFYEDVGCDDGYQLATVYVGYGTTDVGYGTTAVCLSTPPPVCLSDALANQIKLAEGLGASPAIVPPTPGKSSK